MFPKDSHLVVVLALALIVIAWFAVMGLLLLFEAVFKSEWWHRQQLKREFHKATQKEDANRNAPEMSIEELEQAYLMDIHYLD
ncbi:MAG TPA: hypothetical protein VLE69_02555 [Candidatus Saccharimonadales bacterium]|nr:hypothetical protein [Candidatus Saccharimonadales bacterium]